MTRWKVKWGGEVIEQSGKIEKGFVKKGGEVKIEKGWYRIHVFGNSAVFI